MEARTSPSPWHRSSMPRNFCSVVRNQALPCNGNSLAHFTYATTMDVSGSRMRVLKQQGNASQEGYRGRWKSPQRDQYHAGKTRQASRQ